MNGGPKAVIIGGVDAAGSETATALAISIRRPDVVLGRGKRPRVKRLPCGTAVVAYMVARAPDRAPFAGLERCLRANLKHGLYSAEATVQRKRVMVFQREIGRLMAEARRLQSGQLPPLRRSNEDGGPSRLMRCELLHTLTACEDV